jgi:predicted branched-subunit amino acid permease
MRGLRIAKPILLTTTPVGLAFGLYEASKVGLWLLILMLVLLAFIGVAAGYTVARIRRERRAPPDAPGN